MANSENVGCVVELDGALVFEVVIVCDIFANDGRTVVVAIQANEFDLPGDTCGTLSYFEGR